MERSGESGKGWSKGEEGRAGKGFLPWILGWVIGGTHWRLQRELGMEPNGLSRLSMVSSVSRNHAWVNDWNATPCLK